MPNHHKLLREVIEVVGPSICYLRLTKGQVCLVDSDVPESIRSKNWCAAYDPKSGKFYAVGKVSVNGRKFMRKLHRVIASVEDPAILMDHRNGNTLDNRRANLRPATVIQNAQNSRLAVKNTVGLKGFSWEKGAYRARIKPPGGKLVCLGRHATPELAHAAYCAAAIRMYGEFACSG